MAYQLPFRTNTLEEHDQLQLEKDHWINGGTPTAGIALVHELSHAPRDRVFAPGVGRSDLVALTLLLKR
jgi:hypothetical protein